MKKWFRDILFSEYDQEARYLALVRIVLGTSGLAAIGITIGLLAQRPYNENAITINMVIAIGLLSLTFFGLTFRSVLWPGKLFLPVAMTLAVPFIAVQAHGLHDSAISLFPVIILVTTLLLGKRVIPWITALTLIGIWAVAYSDMTGFTDSIVAPRTGFDDIVVISFAQLITASTLSGLMTRLNRALSRSRDNEQAQIHTNQELRELQKSLEERIVERTTELEEANQRNEQRAQQFEAITLVSAALSSIRSLEELLPRVTELISQQFGYYHAGIFLNDANNENAVLSAANSEGGQRMLNRGHQLKIGEQGIVGYTTSTGKPRIALDVGKDAVYFDNPDMPDTRSEMALPLKIGEDVVGALDVQSTEASAFSEDDINVLSLLADQVSLAIENARLFDQARKSLAESEALYRQYLRQAWNRLPKEQNLAGFRYNVRGASPIDAKLQPDIAKGSDVTIDEYQSPRVSVPIAIRGETIGTLSVQIPDSNTFSEDQMDLVNAVAERVAFSAENARLFEETTRRAERERLVSDITVKIRGTNDPDTMIQTALEELKQALGASKVQLIPHTLQKKEAQQQLENPTPQSQSVTSRKNRKK
jgi:GAF domain-containing protein